MTLLARLSLVLLGLAALTAACVPVTADPVSGSLAVQGTRVSGTQAVIDERIVATAEAVHATETQAALGERENVLEAERLRLLREAEALRVEQVENEQRLQILAAQAAYSTTLIQSQTIADTQAYSVTTQAEADAKARAAQEWAESEALRAQTGYRFDLAMKLMIALITLAVLVCIVTGTAFLIRNWWQGEKHREAERTEELNRLRRALPESGVLHIEGYGAVIVTGGQVLPATRLFGLLPAPDEPPPNDVIGGLKGGKPYSLERYVMTSEQRGLAEWLAVCVRMMGADSAFLPSARSMQSRHGIHPEVWQRHVNMLKPVYAEVVGEGSQRRARLTGIHPTLGELEAAVRSGSVQAVIEGQVVER